MKELKFRVWDIELECYLDESELAGITPDGKYILYIEEDEISRLEIEENYIVEQFTGLLDRNGKEVYEGDVVQRTIPNRENYYELYEVVYDSTGAAFKLRMWAKAPFSRKMTHMDIYFADVSLDGLEVIGNLYENSGLLPYKVEG